MLVPHGQHILPHSQRRSTYTTPMLQVKELLLFLTGSDIAVWLARCHIMHTYCCCCLVFQSSPALCDPMECSLPCSSVHGILQARILEWVAMCFSRGYSWPRDQTCVSSFGREILYHWATREALNTFRQRIMYQTQNRERYSEIRPHSQWHAAIQGSTGYAWLSFPIVQPQTLAWPLK